jgi:hypothetical protein
MPIPKEGLPQAEPEPTTTPAPDSQLSFIPPQHHDDSNMPPPHPTDDLRNVKVRDLPPVEPAVGAPDGAVPEPRDTAAVAPEPAPAAKEEEYEYDDSEEDEDDAPVDEQDDTPKKPKKKKKK